MRTHGKISIILRNLFTDDRIELEEASGKMSGIIRAVIESSRKEHENNCSKKVLTQSVLSHLVAGLLARYVSNLVFVSEAALDVLL